MRLSFAITITRALAVASLLVNASGCAVPMIRSQAEVDLDCGRVDVTRSGAGFGSGYVASGCGSSARYFVDSRGGIIGPMDVHSDETPLPGPPLPRIPELLQPPTGAGGFEFGASEDEVRRTCEQTWNAYSALPDGHGSCDGVAADVGAPASASLKFCNGKLCAVSLHLPLAPKDDPARALIRWKAALVYKYGGPTADDSNVPDSCTTDVTPCVRNGTGTIRFEWRWRSGQRITLSPVAGETRTPSLDIAYAAHGSTSRGVPGL